jgi:ElaB/YqjD/DUF883 family membrane-anchored ribosome-binding protein
MSNISNAARDALHEAKGAARDAGKAAAAASGDIQDDLAALRDDIAGLTRQIANIVAARGSTTWNKTKSNVEGAIGEAQDKGMEAVDAVRAAGDNAVDAIESSLKKHPYTTLGLAIGIGFLFGATWRR